MRPILAGNIWQGTRLPRGGQTTHAPARRSDVSVILTDDGKIVEWVKYTPYGEPIGVPAGDVNGDFAYDEDDEAIIYDFIENGGTYDVRLNPTLTGQVDHADIAHARSITNTYQYLGRGVLSSEGVQNRFGYAGYRYDHHLSGGAGAGRHLYHVRHRVYQAHIGRWATRDPLGYVQGMSLYQYVLSQPILRTDPSGLFSPPPSGAFGHGCGWACSSDAEPPQVTEPGSDPPPACPPPPPPAPPTQPLQVCCRPTQTWDPVTHCELRWGCAPGERSYPVWTDPLSRRTLPDGTPCSEATAAQIAACVGQHPGNNRPRRDERYGYENNCQSNTRDKLGSCCLNSNWRPNVYACSIRGRCLRWVSTPRLAPSDFWGDAPIVDAYCVEWEHPYWHDPNVPRVPDPRLPADPFPRPRLPQPPYGPGKEIPS
jgi:RHS repeat-associated protein